MNRLSHNPKSSVVAYACICTLGILLQLVPSRLAHSVEQDVHDSALIHAVESSSKSQLALLEKNNSYQQEKLAKLQALVQAAGHDSDITHSDQWSEILSTARETEKLLNAQESMWSELEKTQNFLDAYANSKIWDSCISNIKKCNFEEVEKKLAISAASTSSSVATYAMRNRESVTHELESLAVITSGAMDAQGINDRLDAMLRYQGHMAQSFVKLNDRLDSLLVMLSRDIEHRKAQDLINEKAALAYFNGHEKARSQHVSPLLD